MIARRITYTGTIDSETAQLIFDIARKIEVTGEIKQISGTSIQLDLEGDPSMIKLVQHQVERRCKDVLQDKKIDSLSFQNYPTLSFSF